MKDIVLDNLQGCADEPFHILIVDDEGMVHMVTEMALKHMHLPDCTFQLHNAYTAAQTLEILEHSDVQFSLIFLDIVMETLTAGLDIIPAIRTSKGGRYARIIIRTGQAGRSSYEDVVAQYNIHGYHDKVTLDTGTLVSAVVIGLRNYIDIVGAQNDKDLRKVRK